jgi:hypothetical protein
MSVPIVSTLARGAAALAMLAVVGFSARSADAQYCGSYFGCSPGGYGGYYGSSQSYPYSYYTGYFGYPSSNYYGYPFYYGNPAYGYSFDQYGFASPTYNYPLYVSGSTYYSFYGTPYRGYYGFGWSSIYGLPTASMVYPYSRYYSTGKEYCFPC